MDDDKDVGLLIHLDILEKYFRFSSLLFEFESRKPIIYIYLESNHLATLKRHKTDNPRD